MISDLEIKLNDVSLSDYFDLTDEPDRGLFPEVQHDLVQMARANGSRATNKRFAHRIITLPLYALSGNFRQTKDDLANVLFAEERQRLWFSDEPDRYWLVELTGETIWKRSLESKGEAFGQLQFLCEDGLAHAMVSKSFPFITTSGDTLATVQNNGTYKTPIDINVTFTSDANSIGFVSSDRIVQLGTSFSEDEDNAVASDKIMNDNMGSPSRSLWSSNVGRIRHNYDNGDNTSKILGAWQWNSEDVTPSSYGSIDETKPGYWHGPTLTRLLTESMTDFEVYHRFEFKPTGTSAQRPTCQGLLEINYSDADNNFVIGFEMKDTESKQDRVSYSFFVGDYRAFQGYLPASVLTTSGGFFGAIIMKKVANQFTFRLVRLNTTTWKESWSSPTKNWYNNAVAMLPVSLINMFAAKWKSDREMSIKLTHTRITQYNTETESLIPKTFYSGDNLFVEGETNRVYINGIRDDSYRVIGSSQVLTAPKGNTEIVAVSDGTFTGNLEIRERYL
ncbi:distal tail protein Dit [Enterococcus casseliflavus]|uniref:distal tail protein Dit n=1 Tax=Enterococcus casseliflavus TaxID=37734 RepID=UPI001BCFF79F|nr:distal tail protein Dit [Enterococcus casseliflavus]